MLIFFPLSFLQKARDENGGGKGQYIKEEEEEEEEEEEPLENEHTDRVSQSSFAVRANSTSRRREEPSGHPVVRKEYRERDTRTPGGERERVRRDTRLVCLPPTPPKCKGRKKGVSVKIG